MKKILSKLRFLALRIFIILVISLQQIHLELFLLPAYADTPNPNEIKFAANIINRENNFAQGYSDIKFQIQAASNGMAPGNSKFTVFLFFGDNLYTSYRSFTASYEQFPLISYKYSKPGLYKPLLIIYSNDLKSKLFQFLDPIKVEKLDLPNPIASSIISNRFEDNQNNVVKINFDAKASYDPTNLFNGNTMTYTWDFGDGVVTEAKALIDHIYTAHGTYTPSLIVKTPDGRTSTKFILNPIVISKETIIPYDEYVKASDLKVNIVSRINQAPLLDSKITYSVSSDNPYMPLSRKKFTIFLFYGDNFYKDYYSFTAPFTGFPQSIVHTYKKAGKYTPLLIAYSPDLTDKVFRFLDPIIITQAQGDKPIAQALIDTRIDDRDNNIVTVNFNASGSFDPRSNSHENLAYIWDYGDGITETNINKLIPHIYRSPGTFIPSLIVRSSDGRLSEKYQLSPIMVSKSVVCLESRDTWLNQGVCQANCGGIIAEQLQVNRCEEERFVPCTTKACKGNSFSILNEYIEAQNFISLLANNSGFQNGQNLTYRFIIDSAVEEPREQIYQNSKFYLNQSGPHTVTLEIYEQSFKASTYTQIINVAEANKAPIAKAKADKYNGEIPLSINFDASESSDPENGTLTYEWGLNNAITASSKTASHTFTDPGTYKVWLKVTDARGLSSQINLQDIIVEEKNYPPIAKFVRNVFDCSVSENGQVALEHKLDGTFACNIELDALFSSDPNRNIGNYYWTINHHDPITNSNQTIQLPQASSPKFTYKFNKFGSYDITLKVTDTKGLASDYNSQLIILEPPPILNAELKNRVDNLVLGSSIMSFSAASSIYYRNATPFNGGAEFLDYNWDWGDGFTANGIELTHNYNKPGVYSPVLNVYRKDDTDKKILSTKNLESVVVTTKIPVVGSLSFDNLIGIEQTDSSSVKGVTIGPINNEQYQWIYRSYEKDLSGKTVLIDKSNDFNSAYGEVNSSILDAPQSFTEAGQYQLVHQLDDKPVLSETLTVLPNQIPIPKLQITYDSGSNLVSVSAEGSYDPKNYEIQSYHWDFGDGSDSNSISTTHNYTSKGIYYIKLTVVDTKGQVANAYSKAIIIGDYASVISNSVPIYKAPIDQENGDESIPNDLKASLKQQSTDDPISDFDSITDHKNDNVSTPIRDLSLPSTGVCSGGSCDCRTSYGTGLKVTSINFLMGNTAHIREKGGALIEIIGSNFCKNEHNVRIKIDSGDFIDRPSTFVDNNKILAKLRSEDFKGANITIRVSQKAADNKFYIVDKIYTNNLFSPAEKTFDVLDGNSKRIDLNTDSNSDYFFFDESTGFGNAYHYFKDGYPTVFSNDALIISKKLKLQTHTANQARLMLHLNGNRFNGIRVWVNDVLILSKDPAAGNKFYEIVSEPFSVSSGTFNLKIKVIGPSDDGVQIKAVTIYTAPSKPFINNLKLNLFGGSTKTRKSVGISMNTTSNTKLQAVHINRKSTTGIYKDKYIILQSDTANSNSEGAAEIIFKETNFKPGTHCSYFYLTNGSKSNGQMAEYIKNNLVKPYNQALSSGKYASINQTTFDYLKNNALSINHGVCFNEDHNVTLSIQSPTEFIEQANNQDFIIQLQSNAPNPTIKANWEYEVKLLNAENETLSTKTIDLPWTKVGTEQIKFSVLRDYIGDYNLLIKARYYDPISYLTYVGEVSTAIHIVDDTLPKAKVVTENINKLILEPSDNPTDKASFLGQYSYDPNRATFASQVNDGIGSYSWTTEYKSLEANPTDDFINIASNYDPNASTYYIGPRKEPGIYRAGLTVRDFFNNSDTAQSDTVQVIRPGQNLVASLSVNNADKIFEPELNGNKEVSFKAKVKIIAAKNNKPSSLNYKFIYGDGIQETGTVDLGPILINQYIDVAALTNRKHIYIQGEYDPRLEVSASFPDGHSETWTVSAGTVTVAKLPSHVAFTPIIANLAPKDIPNPGFIADLKVKSKAIYKTTIESFGWDFGDGTSWTYSGSNPTVDFMKNTVTDKKHTYNNVGTFQIKFWVKTADEAKPIVFTLKPLEIKDTPPPLITSLTINKQATNIQINDEEIINIAGEIDTKVSLQRLEIRVIAKGSNDVVFSKTFTDQVPMKFTETFNDLYLQPGNYILDVLVYDSLEQEGSKSIEFGVEKTKKSVSSIDFSGLTSILNKITYVNQYQYEIPVKILKRIKEFIVYNSDAEIQSYKNINPNVTEANSEEKILIAKLNEGENTLAYKATLPNGKVINIGPHKVILDSTVPFLEIETPVNHSIYKHSKIIVSGTIQDENIDKVIYRLNSNEYKEGNLVIDSDDPGLAEFTIELSEKDILQEPDVNFVEVGTIDKAGNQYYSNVYFISSSNNESNVSKFNSLNLIKGERKFDFFCPQGQTFDEDDLRCYYPGQKECLYYLYNNISLISKPFPNNAYDIESLQVLPFYAPTSGVITNTKGHFEAKQGYPFVLNFDLAVCDVNSDNSGEVSSTEANFKMNQPTILYKAINSNLISERDSRSIIHKSLTYPWSLYEIGNYYTYNFGYNIVGRSPTTHYISWNNFNNSSSSTKGQLKFFDLSSETISDQWPLGYYGFHNDVEFDSITGNVALGQFTDTAIEDDIEIWITPGDNTIDVNSIITIPNTTLSNGSLLTSITIDATVQSSLPISSIDNFKFYYISNDIANREFLINKQSAYSLTPLSTIGTESKYLYNLHLNVYNPSSNGIYVKPGDSLGINLFSNSYSINENDLLSSTNYLLEINKTPLPLMFIGNFQEISDDKHHTSHSPKKFELTLYHRRDASDKEENGTESKYLKYLTITKYDRLGNDLGIVSLDQMRFAISRSSLLSSGNLDTSSETYWETKYTSLGSDNGGTIFRESADLELKMDMTSYFAAKGFYTGPITFDNVAYKESDTYNSYDIEKYRIAPKAVQLKNYDISADKIIFEPANLGLSSLKITYQNIKDIHLFGDYEFDEEITEFLDFRFAAGYSPEYGSITYSFRKGEQGRIDVPAGIYEGNNNIPSLVFDAAPQAETIDIQELSNNSKHFSMMADFFIDKGNNALIKNKRLTEVDKLQKIGMPFAVLAMTDKDLQIELIGGYSDSSYDKNYLSSYSSDDLTYLNKKVNFIDYPQFEESQKVAKYPKVTLKQMNNKQDLFLETYYSNILHKSVDPLEMEVQLFDETNRAIGFPLIITGEIIGQNYLSNVNTKVRNFIKVNLTKNAPQEFKDKFNDADSISMKLLRNKDTYLAKIFDDDPSSAEEYYFVSENDPNRTRKVQIQADFQNRCWIELPNETDDSLSKRRHSHISSDINEIRNLKVKFESASRKGARLWVKQDDLATNNTFNHGQTYSDSDFETIDGQNIELDVPNYTIKNVREGYLLLRRLDIPENTNKVTFNFIVSKVNADPSVISSDSDTNTAVVCGVTYLKNIADGDIIFNNALLANILNPVPAAKDYKVIITTEPDPESIYGVELYIDDLSTNADNLVDPLGTYISNRISNLDGKYLEVNLKDITSGKVGSEYILNAQLIHTPQPGREVRNLPVSRRFMLVGDTEPIITFGANGINDLGDPGSGNNDGEANVIYAPAGLNYQFTREITLNKIGVNESQSINFKLIDKFTAAEGPVILVNEIKAGLAETLDEFIYSIKAEIPFTQPEHIKEYILEVYKGNQRLSQTAEFFIIDDPKLEIDFSDEEITFDEDGKGLAKATIELKNAFDREIHIKAESFVDGDPKNEVEHSVEIDEPVLGKEVDLTINLEQVEVSNSSSNFLVTYIARAIALLLSTPEGQFALGATAAIAPTAWKYLQSTLSNTRLSAVTQQKEIKNYKTVSYGTNAYLDFELYKDGNKLDSNFIYEGSGSYAIKIFSSSAGRVIVKRSVNGGQSETLTGTEIDVSQDDNTTHKFPNPIDRDNLSKFIIKSSYSSNLIPINRPDELEDTEIGISEISITYVDENLREKQKAISMPQVAVRDKLSNVCIFSEMEKAAIKANKPSNKSDLVKYFGAWFTKAMFTSFSISITGIWTQYGIYNDVNPGNVIGDLIRILPQTEERKSTTQRTRQAEGYCRSLAGHIVNHEQRDGLFRIFESPDHRTDLHDPNVNSSENYRVFWLAYGDIQNGNKNGIWHILDQHGYKNKVLRFPVDTRFNTNDDVIRLIENAILQEGYSTLKTPDSIKSADTTFQVNTGNSKKWKDQVGRSTGIYRIYTSSKQSNRIGTVFPLSPGAI